MTSDALKTLLLKAGYTIEFYWEGLNPNPGTGWWSIAEKGVQGYLQVTADDWNLWIDNENLYERISLCILILHGSALPKVDNLEARLLSSLALLGTVQGYAASKAGNKVAFLLESQTFN